MDKDKNRLNTYLNEIGQQKLLSDEEERELAQRIQIGDSRAIEKLTSANLTFVVSLANQYKGRGLAAEDLISEGNIGMLHAATKFAGSKGKRFVTFAAPYIREAMEQAIEQQAGLYRVPRDVMDAALEKKRSYPLSIDAPVGGSMELSLGHVLPNQDSPNPDQQLEEGLLLDELKELISQLDVRQQHVVQLFYGIGVPHLTMTEIAQEMGLKRERIRQIRDKAVRKICKLTKNTDLKDYLRK